LNYLRLRLRYSLRIQISGEPLGPIDANSRAWRADGFEQLNKKPNWTGEPGRIRTVSGKNSGVREIGIELDSGPSCNEMSLCRRVNVS